MVFWVWTLPRVEENLSNGKGCLSPVQSGLGLVLRQKGDPRVQMNFDASRVLGRVQSPHLGVEAMREGVVPDRLRSPKRETSCRTYLSVPIGHFQDQSSIIFISQVVNMPPFLCILHLLQSDLSETPVWCLCPSGTPKSSLWMSVDFPDHWWPPGPPQLMVRMKLVQDQTTDD